jgi:hypothetical protein
MDDLIADLNRATDLLQKAILNNKDFSVSEKLTASVLIDVGGGIIADLHRITIILDEILICLRPRS